MRLSPVNSGVRRTMNSPEVPMPPVDYDKYTRAEFERLGHDTPEAKRLAMGLQADIEAELNALVRPAFMQILEGLRRRGHDLTVIDDTASPTLCVHAVHEIAPDTWALNVAYDLTISTGYPDTTREE
jgi:hypothetical protein